MNQEAENIKKDNEVNNNRANEPKAGSGHSLVSDK